MYLLMGICFVAVEVGAGLVVVEVVRLMVDLVTSIPDDLAVVDVVLVDLKVDLPTFSVEPDELVDLMVDLPKSSVEADEVVRVVCADRLSTRRASLGELGWLFSKQWTRVRISPSLGRLPRHSCCRDATPRSQEEKTARELHVDESSAVTRGLRCVQGQNESICCSRQPSERSVHIQPSISTHAFRGACRMSRSRRLRLVALC